MPYTGYPPPPYTKYHKDIGFTRISQVVLTAAGGPDPRTPLDAAAPAGSGTAIIPLLPYPHPNLPQISSDLHELQKWSWAVWGEQLLHLLHATDGGIYYHDRSRRPAQICRYLVYSEADFEAFRPAGATRCTDGGEIWHGGPLLHDKFHPIGATTRM